ncbi:MULTISPECIES: hypothetical protein [unclassified Nostoc]|uniref:Uncharacterized protein n=1 Tax=Nostoc punctiforme NIES-2108 TaxID=1356359 RepID=A0A367RSW9_NOSPU|nr:MULTISPECIES: hypothetical protein [unclassified Nostoc]AVH68990.1 hypothetical protein NLP_0032 [Nostoc sp. 'Lobaria pulmonaria (5183) cyanobiont']MBN3891220.1 hypothetical protein [Nostoc sp. JL31]RCJ38921.1 hypothetical protein A6769_07730 [Nostoc punctiforme NIES-2108]
MSKDNRGNPEIKNHGFKTDRDKPLTEYINLRVTKEMKEEVKAKDDPPEFCRRAIQKALDEEKEK